MKLSSRNIAAVIVLVILLVYGGLKGLVFYKYKKALDTASAQMRIFATLRYDGISSSLLDNSVTVHKVVILPSGFEDSINIDAITLTTDGIGSLISGPGSKGKSFPPQLDIALRGLKIDLYGSMIDRMEQAMSQLAGFIPETLQTACGNKLYLGPSEYREMGYDILDSNLVFRYAFSDTGIDVSMDWSTRDMASASLEMHLSGPGRASAAAIMSSPPELQHMTISYHDLSYTQRSNEYCARIGNYASVEEYINATTNQSDAVYSLQWGFVPGPGLKQAYKDFLTTPGTISVSLRPPKGFNQSTIGLYKPDDLVAALNLELKVNDKPVQDLSFAFTPGEEGSTAPAMSMQERLQNFGNLLQQKEIKPVERAKPIKPKATPRFYPVAVGNLKSFIGKKCRVYTDNNQVRRGTLSAITPGTVHVTQQVHRGEFTMNIEKKTIKKVEVLYVK